MAQRQKKKNRLLLEEKKAKAKGFKFIAGIDEAGRGPLAGPVVAASVILKSPRFINRIDDSKRLTALSRERAYNEILTKAVVGIGIIPESVIDRINIHRATVLAMENAVLNLNVVPDMLLIDGNISLRIDTEQLSIVNGDQKSMSIACASIVAKVTRDRLLRFYDGIFPGYGFAKHKGYGTKAHIEALGEKGLSPLHRTTFKVSTQL